MEMVEGAADQLGLPLTTPARRCAFGGHAFRIAGAMHQAMKGIEGHIVKLLAQWGSEVIDDYLKDTPL